MIEIVRSCQYLEINSMINNVLWEENQKCHKLIHVNIKHQYDDTCSVKFFFVQEDAAVDQKVVVISLETWENFRESYVDENVKKLKKEGYDIQFWQAETFSLKCFTVLCFEM